MMLASTSNMLISLEDLKRLFPKLRVDVVDERDLPNDEARAYPKRWRIKMRRGMYDGLLRGDARARWSLAHELAHIFLQHAQRSHARPRNKDLETQYEREANLFAANFLAPYERIKSARKMEDIRDLCKISAGAAITRFSELKRDEKLRRIAKQTGNPPESATIELGSCPHLEHQATQIAIAINDTIKTRSPSQSVLEPLNSSLLAISLFTSAGSDLLLHAYIRSKHLLSPQLFDEAAALAIAILVLQPLRSERGMRSDVIAISESNKECAKRAIAAMLKIDLARLDDLALPHPNRSCQYEFEPSYIYPLCISVPRIVDDGNLIKVINCLPNETRYAAVNKICESELADIETLASAIECAAR